MEFLIVFAIVFLSITLITWRNTVIEKQNIIIRKQNEELIQSVTSLSRGNPSELNLILTLLKSGIHPKAIFHDLYIAKKDGKFSQIDLVVATKVGIIVFEVKDFSGWIYGKGNQTKWTQVLAYGNKKNRFYNPIIQNNSHIKQLRQKLKENVPFYSVIVFYGDSELRDISFVPQKTFVTKDYRVLDVIDTILNKNQVATYKNKQNVINILKDAVKNGNPATEMQHTENINDMLGTNRIFQ